MPDVKYEVVYRDFKLSDLPAVEKIYLENREELIPPVLESEIKNRIIQFRTGKSSLVVAVDRTTGELLGFAGYNLEGFSKRKGRLHSQNVSSKARGIGIGTGLSNWVKNTLISQGANKVSLVRDPSNVPGASTDKKTGFVHEKKIRKKTYDGVFDKFLRTFKVKIHKKRWFRRRI